MDFTSEIINIGICDDDKHMLENVSGICKSFVADRRERYQFYLFNCGRALLKHDNKLDVLFLDIAMPDIDGLSVAAALIEKQKDIRIIFLTSHNEMVQEAFKVKAFRYLYKSCTNADIRDVLSDAIDDVVNVCGVMIENDKGSFWIKLSDIVYIESLGDGTAIHTNSGVIINSDSLKHWYDILDDSFFKCHKSYIVNMYYIMYNEQDVIIMKNNDRVPVSVRNRKSVKVVFHEFIKKNARYM